MESETNDQVLDKVKENRDKTMAKYLTVIFLCCILSFKLYDWSTCEEKSAVISKIQNYTFSLNDNEATAIIFFPKIAKVTTTENNLKRQKT